MNKKTQMKNQLLFALSGYPKPPLFATNQTKLDDTIDPFFLFCKTLDNLIKCFDGFFLPSTRFFKARSSKLL